MIESPSNSELGVWHVPECPFTIEYSTAVMDDIRAAAVDAFYALRGGAEIGGVLLGKVERGIQIEGFQTIECEHALGPTFALSDNDRRGLEQLLEELESDAARSGLYALGWWVSHARSDVHLTERDLDLYDRYFPEAWQVTLVLRPAHMQPARAGFFFRERNGTVQTASTYREFLLHAIPRLKAPGAAAPSTDSPASSVEEVYTEAAPMAVTAVPSLEVPPPHIHDIERERAPEPYRSHSRARPVRSRRWVWVSMLLGFLTLTAGYGTRDYWLPLPQDPLSLETTDWRGQLLIQWNGSGAAIRRARHARLEISDAADKRVLELDEKLRRAGTFSHVRQSERVDVRLTLIEPDGKVIEETTSFFGKLPSSPRLSPADADARRQREQLVREAERMKADLLNQAQRTRKLERTVEDLSQQLSRKRKK